MTRTAVAAVIVVSLAVAGCSQPDVALGGAGGGSTADPASAVAQPPGDKPFLEGPIDSISRTEPRTTDCVSEADADGDGDGVVSSNDPPVCNPNPSTLGTIGVKGNRADQGGATEIRAFVEKTVPIVRRGAGGEIEPVGFDELSKGDVISLWITGPVMESYPLQGAASYILVEE